MRLFSLILLAFIAANSKVSSVNQCKTMKNRNIIKRCLTYDEVMPSDQAKISPASPCYEAQGSYGPYSACFTKSDSTGWAAYSCNCKISDCNCSRKKTSMKPTKNKNRRLMAGTKKKNRPSTTATNANQCKTKKNRNTIKRCLTYDEVMLSDRAKISPASPCYEAQGRYGPYSACFTKSDLTGWATFSCDCKISACNCSAEKTSTTGTKKKNRPSTTGTKNKNKPSTTATKNKKKLRKNCRKAGSVCLPMKTPSARATPSCRNPPRLTFSRMCLGQAYGTWHTMCRYTSMGRSCGRQFCARGLTQAEKMDIVRLHNEYRRYVAKGKETRGYGGAQPSAANMMKVQWSDEMAAVAQRWADQCNYNHDPKRSTPNHPQVGQNIGFKGESRNGGDPFFFEIIQSWYDEVAVFNPQKVAKYSSSVDGDVTTHYSAMIWAETTHIGCGFVHYRNGRFYRRQFLCNYSPQGNWIGSQVYQQGAAGSDCTGENDNGLCL